MRQLKYVMLDYKQRFGTVLVLIVLCTFMLLLSTLFINSFVNSFESLQSIKKFQDRNAYYAVDDTLDYKIDDLMNDSGFINKELNFFKQFDRNQYVTEYGYDMDVTDDGKIISQRSVSKSFFDLYNIKVYEGSIFENEDFKEKKEITPVIVGYNLKSKYKIGSLYEFVNGGTGETFQGKVIGILASNSEFYEFNYSDLPISLDNSYVIPIFENYKVEDMSFSDIDMALSHLIVFSNDIESIQKKHNDIEGFVTTFINCNDKIEYVIDIQINNIILFVAVLLVVLLFIIAILWTTFNKMIKQQVREYGIHILCGATYLDILKRFVLFTLNIFIISNIFVFVYEGISVITISTFLFSLVIASITLIYPYYKLKRLDAIMIMKD